MDSSVNKPMAIRVPLATPVPAPMAAPMPKDLGHRFKVGDRVNIKNDRDIYTITGYDIISCGHNIYGYTATYVGRVDGREVIGRLSWLPDGLITGRASYF